MTRRRKILDGPYEVLTHQALEKAAGEYGARVWAKVRVADALDIDRSGLSRDEYSYALKSHFDFIVSDDEHRTLFAVEFDGQHHNVDPVTIRRDAMKEAICERLDLPLLRVDRMFLRSIGRFVLLGWLAEVWFLNEAFDREQVTGRVPYDEVFCYSFILGMAYRSEGELVSIDNLEPSEQLRVMQEHEGRLIVTQPYDPFMPSRAYVSRAFRSGLCREPMPEELEATDPAGFQVCVAVLQLDDHRYVIGHSRVRSFRFAPISPYELALELSVVDAADKLKRVLKGEGEAGTLADVEAWRARMAAWRVYH